MDDYVIRHDDITFGSVISIVSWHPRNNYGWIWLHIHAFHWNSTSPAFRWIPASVVLTSSWDTTDVVYIHENVFKWTLFLRYWPFVRWIHRSPVNSPTKASNARLWCFFHVGRHKILNKQVNDRRFQTTWRSRDVILMLLTSEWNSNHVTTVYVDWCSNTWHWQVSIAKVVQREAFVKYHTWYHHINCRVNNNSNTAHLTIGIEVITYGHKFIWTTV